jgi:hypothetical protein
LLNGRPLHQTSQSDNSTGFGTNRTAAADRFGPVILLRVPAGEKQTLSMTLQ